MQKRICLFGVPVDPLRMEDAVSQLAEWTESHDHVCRFVVTPNVDHMVMLQHHDGLRAAYKDAAMVVADGHPVVWASRLLRRPVPERVPGSDLVPSFFSFANSSTEPLRVFLLGAPPGVGERAAKNIQHRWPAVEVVGTYSPPMGFERNDEENRRILYLINSSQPDVLIVGLGAPKQELWVHRHQNQIRASVALCVGATIDFLAGEKRRAPVWIQKSGLEWLHRMLSEPKRLVRRYARDAWIFPQLVWREWRLNGRGQG